MFIAVLFALLAFNLFGSSNKENEIKEVIEVNNKAKYLFLFIGDGVSMSQISAAEAYLQAENEGGPGLHKLRYTEFPAQGLTTTYSSNSFITDSAAAGTALACGEKTDSGVISMDSSKTKKFKSIATIAKERGMKVGIVSTVNLDHATPAVFYSNSASRNSYYDINIALANSNFDYFAGGMVRIGKTPEGKKSAHDIMKENGTIIVNTRESLNALKNGVGKVYAYNEGFAFNALDYSIDQDENDITLAEFTKKGIELLENKDGFFMMVEAGKIDWACHANDAGASIHDTIALDDAVQEAIFFYNKHPEETIIVVTGDHETGGLTLGFAGTKYSSAFEVLKNQKMSYEAYGAMVFEDYKNSHTPDNSALKDLIPSLEENFGLTELSDYEVKRLSAALTESLISDEERINDQENYLLYGTYEPFIVTVTHLLNQRAGVAWTSYSHTGVPVPTFALGVSSDLFNGYYDNTDIFKKMMMVLN